MCCSTTTTSFRPRSDVHVILLLRSKTCLSATTRIPNHQGPNPLYYYWYNIEGIHLTSHVLGNYPVHHHPSQTETNTTLPVRGPRPRCPGPVIHKLVSLPLPTSPSSWPPARQPTRFRLRLCPPPRRLTDSGNFACPKKSHDRSGYCKVNRHLHIAKPCDYELPSPPVQPASPGLSNLTSATHSGSPPPGNTLNASRSCELNAL